MKKDENPIINVFQDETFRNPPPPVVANSNLLFQYDRDVYVNKPKLYHKSFDAYMIKWKEFTHNLFEGFNWSNILAAGGSILGCLLSVDKGFDIGYETSDIDLFMVNISKEDATKKLREILAFFKEKSPNHTMIRTKNCCSFILEPPFRTVQVVLKIFKSAKEVLDGFDVDCCSVGFDSQDVFAINRSRRSIIDGINTIDIDNRSNTYETRLFKYARRGFAVEIPNLANRDIPATIYSQDAKYARGFQRLLILDFYYTMSGFNPLFDVKMVFGNDNDYSQLDLPPGLHHKNVNKVLNYKDKAQFFWRKRTKISDHSHVLIVGEENVFRGLSGWCKLCQEGQIPDTTQVSGEIKWQTQNPGKQNPTIKYTEDQWFDLTIQYPKLNELNQIKGLIIANQEVPESATIFSPKTFKRQPKTSKVVSLIQSNHLVSLACIMGSNISLESLLKVERYRKFVNTHCENGYYPLQYAVAGGSQECVEILLQHGALKNLRSNNSYGWTSNYMARVYNTSESLIELTSRFKGGNITQSQVRWMDQFHHKEVTPVNVPKGIYKMTPIKELIGGGYVSIFKEALKTIKIQNWKDSMSQSLLHLAIQSPKPREIFDIIIQQDPTFLDRTPPNKFGQNLQDYCMFGLTSIQSLNSYLPVNGSKYREDLQYILQKCRKPSAPYCMSQIPINFGPITASKPPLALIQTLARNNNKDSIFSMLTAKPLPMTINYNNNNKDLSMAINYIVNNNNNNNTSSEKRASEISLQSPTSSVPKPQYLGFGGKFSFPLDKNSEPYNYQTEKYTFPIGVMAKVMGLQNIVVKSLVILEHIAFHNTHTIKLTENQISKIRKEILLNNNYKFLTLFENFIKGECKDFDSLISELYSLTIID
ncbi:hypothetical protein DLAC_05920 [Tieghemostelium lacteum]|uniref:Uncharacterized protein n=1 Tax=Tieghemostelium lacteum TaxID=361077 RepID=A0A151ZHC5_TIELA|nr:hypothetical protein DLAC_05920 [Tieghemostelium lacteum]|eukprot:KYQ93264.1 hypothetical protein DLAC_05920 [Tieghemostelium lacteum]